jgi:hypothetical protein
VARAELTAEDRAPNIMAVKSRTQFKDTNLMQACFGQTNN